MRIYHSAQDVCSTHCAYCTGTKLDFGAQLGPSSKKVANMLSIKYSHFTRTMQCSPASEVQTFPANSWPSKSLQISPDPAGLFI